MPTSKRTTFKRLLSAFWWGYVSAFRIPLNVVTGKYSPGGPILYGGAVVMLVLAPVWGLFIGLFEVIGELDHILSKK